MTPEKPARLNGWNKALDKSNIQNYTCTSTSDTPGASLHDKKFHISNDVTEMRARLPYLTHKTDSPYVF